MDSTLSIHIMRVDKEVRFDDLIRAKRVGGNIHITHTDGSHGTQNHVTTTVLTHSSLANYVTTLVSMIRDDTDPFHSIQFNFPGFPAVVYTVARLHNPAVMRTLKEAAHMTSDYWFRNDPGYNAHEDGDSSSDGSSTTSFSSSSSSSSSSGSTRSTDSMFRNLRYPPLPRHVFFD